MLGKLITFPKCNGISQVIILVEYLAWQLRTAVFFFLAQGLDCHFLPQNI